MILASRLTAFSEGGLSAGKVLMKRNYSQLLCVIPLSSRDSYDQPVFYYFGLLAPCRERLGF